MIFVWFFKSIFFYLKRFVAYLSDFQALVVLTVLFLLLLLLIYKEFLKDAVTGRFASESGFSPDFWDFISVIVPGMDKVPMQYARGYRMGYMPKTKTRIGRISFN